MSESGRKYTQVKEKDYLIPLSRRQGIFYLEHAKLVRKESDVRVLAESSGEGTEVTLPVASIGALLRTLSADRAVA